MNTLPVTVLMPAYNAENYITEAIRSVLTQSFTDFELLIINNSSTDNTVDKILQFDDPRIRLIEEPERGVGFALNTGLREAKGEFIARFDADDVCYPDRLRIQYDFMKNNPDYILTGSEADYMDMNGEYVFTLKYKAYTDTEIRNLDSSVCPFSHVTVMYKKNEVNRIGGYDTHAHTFEDHLLWLKIIHLGKVCNLPQSWVKVRFNPESVTIDEKWRGKAFIQLKYDCIRDGRITPETGERLLEILKKQDTQRLKKGAYYSLIAKKYLWDNYQPVKARWNLGRLISCYPVRPGAYLLYLASFLPRDVINLLYRNWPKRS
jgi:glycosyltransferase involved in cell wall biosynthesis